MKRIFFLNSVVLLMFLLMACDDNGKNVSFGTEIEHKIESVVTKNLVFYGGKDPVPGAVVGIWMPGKGTYIKGFGYSDLSIKKPMDIHDKFRIGSNTKTFVMTVLLQLVDEGRLTLDDKLSKFDLGVTVPNAQNMTVRQLCNMTSGLFEAYDSPQFNEMELTPYTKITPQLMIEMAVLNPPNFAPGEKWGYSNTNYLLLGLIVEAVTGNRIENEIRDRLLTPNGLKNTSFPISDPGMPSPYSHGYTLDQEGDWVDETVLLNPSLTWAAGVMISDMNDIKKWVKEYVTGGTNGASTQTQRLTCVDTGSPNLKFGLGIGCTGGWFGYTGGIPGYNTAAYYLPSEDATVIVFINSQREKPKPGVANAIFHDITEILFPENIAFHGSAAK